MIVRSEVALISLDHQAAKFGQKLTNPFFLIESGPYSELLMQMPFFSRKDVGVTPFFDQRKKQNVLMKNSLP